ncbi:MAG: ABC transporter permease, partial [Gemmatimonadales bacterium]
MDSVLQDLRHSLRALRRSPGFAVAAILTLALGLGANTAIFSIVSGVLLRPLPYEKPDRLIGVWGRHAAIGLEAASLPDFLDWRAGAPSLERLAGLALTRYPVSGTDQSELVPGALITADFFRTLGVTMAAGRDFQDGEDGQASPHVAIIGYGYWQRRFGGRADAIGHQISIGRESPYTIVGVAPKGLRVEGDVDLWTPLPLALDQGRRSDFLHVIGRLRPGATVAGAQQELATLARRLQERYPDTNSGWDVYVVSLQEQLVGEVRPALLVFLGAVGLVLLIACANVANLMLGRLASRQREITVRSALGASRGRLTQQVLTESVLLALAGGGLGLLLAVWGVQALRLSSAGSIPRMDDIAVSLPALGFAFALSIVTGLTFGLVPAVRLMGHDLHAGLASGGRSVAGGPGVRGLRGGLVAAEVATAFVLLTGAGLLLRSFVRLLEVDPGFRSADVLTATVSLPRVKYSSLPQRVVLYDQLLERVRAM